MLKDRLKSSSILLTLAGVAFFWSGIVGVVVFSIMALFLLYNGINEFANFIKKMGYSCNTNLLMPFSLVYLAGIAYLSATEVSLKQLIGFEILVIFALLIVGFLQSFYAEDRKKGLIRHLITLGGFLYIAWPLGFLLNIYFLDGMSLSGRYLAILLILMTKSGDIGAYITGSLMGKRPGGNHPIAPKLSPKKSWEGFFGGIAFSAIIGLIIYSAVGDKLPKDAINALSYPIIIVMGALFTLLGFWGDISESAFKRAANVKDSGSILPGMGGAMDVLDSLIFTIPVFYGYLMLVS